MTRERLREWLIDTLASIIVAAVWMLLAWGGAFVTGASWDRMLLLIIVFTLAERLPSKRKLT